MVGEMTETKPYLVAVGYWGSHGRSSFTGVCSKCGEIFTVYVWSFHGCGKRCPNCKQLYGKADVRKPEIVKHEGKYVIKAVKWLFDVNNKVIGEAEP